MKASTRLLAMIIFLGCTPLIYWWVECNELLIEGLGSARCFHPLEYLGIVLSVVYSLIIVTYWLKYRKKICDEV